MSKLEDARDILKAIGMPGKQQADLCCYSLLALCNISKKSRWAEATNEWIRIHDILHFSKDCYQITYAENSRETFRKQAMHQFRDAALTEDNGKPTNSPNYRYRITDEALQLIRSYGSREWKTQLSLFKASAKNACEN